MFLTKRFYFAATFIILLLSGGYLWQSLFLMGQFLLILLGALVACDAWMLFRTKGIAARRHCTDRFSNGDDNLVSLRVESRYPFPVHLSVVDEIPFVFQRRDINFRLSLRAGEAKTIEYHLCPTTRGEYAFGRIRLFAVTVLGLMERRYTCGEPEVVKVYPSYLMLHRYELLAIHNHLTEMGIKKIRRFGHQSEFEQIKDYIKGDDYRTINWKASARRGHLMVNVYQDERSQQVYNVIDKGRMMQRAFDGMTLLDYAINASLVLSYITIHKEDKAGLATFSDRFDTFISAERQSGQMQALLEALYKQQTTFGESDFSSLCIHVNKYINKRSLLILYTNFDNLSSMQRELPYLRQLNRQHRLLVIFFDDAELSAFAQEEAKGTEELYQQVIAQKFLFEKRLIVSTLKQNGIYSLLTTPKNLSVDVINKYLEIKRAGF